MCHQQPLWKVKLCTLLLNYKAVRPEDCKAVVLWHPLFKYRCSSLAKGVHSVHALALYFHGSKYLIKHLLPRPFSTPEYLFTFQPRSIYSPLVQSQYSHPAPRGGGDHYWPLLGALLCLKLSSVWRTLQSKPGLKISHPKEGWQVGSLKLPINILHLDSRPNRHTCHLVSFYLWWDILHFCLNHSNYFYICTWKLPYANFHGNRSPPIISFVGGCITGHPAVMGCHIFKEYSMCLNQHQNWDRRGAPSEQT